MAMWMFDLGFGRHTLRESTSFSRFQGAWVGRSPIWSLYRRKNLSLQEIQSHVHGNSACGLSVTLIASCPPP